MDAPTTPEPRSLLGHSQFARLILLRWFSVAVMVVAAWLLPTLVDGDLPQTRLLAVALLMAGFNLASLAWQACRQAPGAFALFVQLGGDLLGWSLFLYLSGGAANPLISLLLPLVAIGAAILPARLGWLLAALAMAAYSLLWQWHRPIIFHDHAAATHWHLAGMWLTFVLSALVVVWFVLRAASALRLREQELAAARAARARDEQIVALGNLAAGAAHKLGTPLGTLRILVDELARSLPDNAAAQEDLALMGEQVEHCKQILGGLTARAGHLRAEGGGASSARDWVEATVARWQALRPHAAATLECDAALGEERIVADATLAEALHTLFNNAADVSPDAVSILAVRRDGQLVVEVGDRGPGIPPALQAALGQAPVSEKPGGMGIGLFLARAAVSRHDGTLTLTPRPGGGTMARLSLPLERIRA